MAVHYNVQVSIQEVREAVPPRMDQYGKVTQPAQERQVVEVLRFAVTQYSMADAVDAAIGHLRIEEPATTNT